MRMAYLVALTIMLLSNILYSQEKYSLSGTVSDELNKPLPGCHIHFNQLCVITDLDGSFSINNYHKDTILLRFSFIGFEQIDTLICLTKTDRLNIALKQDLHSISQVNISANKIDTIKTRKNEVVSTDFLTQNITGTFIKSIEKLPGVNSMDIGANASKPIVRGMGFNRVVVSENGIKQEGQQWGADHGLEMDPFAIETAEIVKGASAIEHGSDAIGGYINISNDKIPNEQQVSGNLSLIGKSVNNTIGGSLFIHGRAKKIFFKLRGSLLDFGDYKIPTDTIIYLTRPMPIVNRELKNTAGREYDLYGQAGYVTSSFRTLLTASNVRQKTGFFPGSHGIPDLQRVQDDGDKRNVEFPYQNVNHFKLINNTKIFFNESILCIDLAYQNNHRQEWSFFHTHYPGQKAPEEYTDLELDFKLQTFNAHMKFEFNIYKQQRISIGIQTQWRENNIAGYNFLLPEYNTSALGFFVKDDFIVSEKLKLIGALRFDFGSLITQNFYDSLLYNYYRVQGLDEGVSEFYANRGAGLNRSYGDFSWLLGGIYTPTSRTIVRLNIGKVFRTPTAMELASNGIHHGSFRHELGSNKLNSEKGYYVDGNFEWHTRKLNLSISPYLYYFYNYIYLNPSGKWSLLPHAGQIYQYTQSKALLSGLELSLNKSLFDLIKIYLSAEYIYNQQITDEVSKEFPLPYTPAPNGFIEIDYHLFRNNKTIIGTKLFVNSRFVLAQDNVAQNELKTPAYIIYGCGFSTKIKTKNSYVNIVLQASNILNTRYFNHISFYRKLEIPEQGRNFQLLLKVPFQIKK